MQNNFPLSIPGSPFDISPNGSNVLLRSSVSKDLMIYNPGPAKVWLLAHNGQGNVDTSCMPILPGEKGVYGKMGQIYLAGKAEGTSNQTIYLFEGEGW